MSWHWVYGSIAVLTLLHGVALLYAYRNASAAVGTDGEQAPRGEGVECPSCGEHNETGYRYCRQCVSELPSRMSFLDDSTTPEERRTM